VVSFPPDPARQAADPGVAIIAQPGEDSVACCAIPIDPRSVEGCEGTYRFPDFTLTLTRANGKVFWDDGSGKNELKTDDNRLFYAVSSVDVIEFERDASGRIRGAIDRAFDNERAPRQP